MDVDGLTATKLLFELSIFKYVPWKVVLASQDLEISSFTIFFFREASPDE